MKALLYACTTAADLGQTVNDEKLPQLRRYAGMRGWEIAGEFTDAIPTGMGRRPGFEDLCAALKAGRGEVVIATAIDELAWDLASGLKRLRDLGLGDGVQLVCLENSFDATTPTGAIRLLDAMTLVAEHRAGRNRRRQRIGYLRKLAAADGDPIAGRPRLAVNQFEIKTLWERALSQRAIQAELHRLGCPISKGLLHKIIQECDSAGILDHAARQSAAEARGGLPRAGRPKKPQAAAPVR